MVIIRWKPSKQTCCCRKEFKIPIYNPRRLGEQLVWSNWESLGGVLYSGPDACSWGPGRLDIFVKAVAGNINHKWFDNGRWYDWEPLGAPPGVRLGLPTAASWGNGRIDIFAKGYPNNALWHKYADLYTF